MSLTPRTDALPRIRQAGEVEYVPIDDCRQLECELAEARDEEVAKNLHRLLENILKPDSDGQDYKEARKYLAILKGGEA